MIELIKRLSETWGPSGYEHHVRRVIRQEVEDLADVIQVDSLGNMICRVGEGGTRIMVAAHMDEIGMMAMFAEKQSGYLRFSNLGGLLKDTLRGNRVRFEDGTTGVIAVNGGGGSSLDDFYIDVDDGSKPLIEAGVPATLWRECEGRGSRVIGKAMDDRIGCVVAIETMRKLADMRKQAKRKKLANEVVFVFTVQEEVGLRGARAAGFGVDPEVAIALDVTRSGDESQGAKMAVKLGGGAAIKMHDPGLVVPPQVREWMIQRAEKDKIPYQLEMLAGGTTDAAAIQVARSGVPSGVISIPCRYVHTTSETVDLGDVQACINLLTGLAANPVDLSVD